MNLETKKFVISLLHKYNTHQDVIDPESLITNDSQVIGYVEGEVIELESVDAFSLIGELCEALNITEDVLKVPIDADPELMKELKTHMDNMKIGVYENKIHAEMGLPTHLLGKE
jgi:hypothetical protein